MKVCANCNKLIIDNDKFCNMKCYGEYRSNNSKLYERLGSGFKTGVSPTIEVIKKMSEAKIGKPPWWIIKNVENPAKSLIVRKINSDKHKGKKPWNKGLTVDTDERVRKYVEKSFPKLLKFLHVKPNLSEKILIKLFNDINLPYKYCGDFTVTFGRKSPDFINCNGQKKLIELFGAYWHEEKGKTREEVENKRKEIFKPYGFDTLIIWDDELKDLNKLKDKIINYNDKVINEV